MVYREFLLTTIVRAGQYDKIKLWVMNLKRLSIDIGTCVIGVMEKQYQFSIVKIV